MVFYSPVPYDRVDIDDAFWSPRQKTNRQVTLKHIYQQFVVHGYFDAYDPAWKPGDPHPPHVFWESDVAKWLEAVAYSLQKHPDPELDALADEVIARLVSIQQPDGYLNIHFTKVEPEKRWSNLRDWHEMYCAGHLVEAAVAHFQATGKRSLLDPMICFMDHIGREFGPNPGQKRGYCGHPEIELALVRLYHATGMSRFLELSRYFVEERGQHPHYYDQEALARGDNPAKYWAKTYAYLQADRPVRQQTSIEGHAVRACYLYSAATDLAMEDGGDAGLLETLRQLVASTTKRRQYVTGGIGSAAHNEGFTVDYDLPNASAYTETCAAIALFFWMHRMNQAEGLAEYADLMERALYNGILSGLALDGAHFLYVNPLAIDRRSERAYHRPLHRLPWYDCACCPPNIARLVASLGGYIYGEAPDAATVNLYVQSTARLAITGQAVTLRQETAYPWKGQVQLTVTPEYPAEFVIRLRQPSWCTSFNLSVNGTEVVPTLENGYLVISQLWMPGDVITLELDMPVERLYANPAVPADAGRVTLQRGPLVYCLEGVDYAQATEPGHLTCQVAHLDTLFLPRSAAVEPRFEPDLLGGMISLHAEGLRLVPFSRERPLYTNQPPEAEPCHLVAVPYFAWDNRQPGDLQVWILEK